MALALGVLGVLTRRILEEAIGAEDLNKVHLMETAIASNATLQGSFDQIERLAYRLLDWGDFRIYRVATARPSLAYRGTLGRPNRGEPPAKARRRFAAQAIADEPGRRGAGRAARDPRVPLPMLEVGSLVIHPIRFGDELLGIARGGSPQAPRLRLQGSHRRSARSANQMATAIHIAELRRPLLSTVSRSASR